MSESNSALAKPWNHAASGHGAPPPAVCSKAGGTTGAAGCTACRVQEQQARAMKTAEIDLGHTATGPGGMRCKLSMGGPGALLYICKDAPRGACVSVNGGVNCSNEYLAG